MHKLFAVLALLALPLVACGETKVHKSQVSATGTPSSTTFLRGDGAWSAPAFSGLTGSATVAQGGTGLTAAADDTILVGDGTGFLAKAMPECPASQQILYTAATNTFSCVTPAGAPAGSAWLSASISNSTTTYSEAAGLRVTIPTTGNYDIEFVLDTYTTTFATAAQTKVTFTGTSGPGSIEGYTFTSGAGARLERFAHADAVTSSPEIDRLELLPTTKTDQAWVPAIYRFTLYNVTAGAEVKVYFRTSSAGTDSMLVGGSSVRWTRF